MGMITGSRAALLAALTVWPCLVQGAEVATTQADRKDVTLTIYNDDLALVREIRRLELGRGTSRLTWRDVPAQLRPETALLRNLSNPTGFRVNEQDFDFDLLTPERLLAGHVGREVWVIRPGAAAGQEKRESAVVLAAVGPVLQFADRIETGMPGRLAFPGVPAGLHDRPTLTATLVNAATGAQDVELSYLTGGLSWRADYIAELSASDDRLDLRGWATLTNQSGAAYREATVQFVAGDIHRVREDAPAGRVLSMAKADAPEMQREDSFEYHLYRLPGSTTLADNQTKQIALMSAVSVPARKTFLVEGAPYYYLSRHPDAGQKQRVGVHVEFDNRGEGLGTPLPRGVMRFYKRDSQGSVQFVGEDRIEHTPRNETVRVKLGDAFDVTADRKQTDFRQAADATREAPLFESAYEIVLKNAKAEAVTVTVREPMPGDWRVLSESHPHSKVSSGLAEWKVKVPAQGRATLSYRVRVRN